MLSEISKHLQSGNASMVDSTVRKALEQGLAPGEILSNGLINGMNVIGERFKNNDIFIPEVLIAARAMYAGMDVLKPLLVDSDINSFGKVVIGTVKGDLHDIGKNLVMMMMEGAGFEVIDLGTDVSDTMFLEAVKKHNPNIVAMSALLTTTMPYMRKIIDGLKRAGVRDGITVMIGGAPVTESFTKEIQADIYASNAVNAVEKAKQWLGIIQ